MKYNPACTNLDNLEMRLMFFTHAICEVPAMPAHIHSVGGVLLFHKQTM